MDDQGRGWVTSPELGSSVDLDIHRHRDWIVESIPFETLEDRRNFLDREMSPDRSEQTGEWLDDFNEDGVHDWQDLTTHKESVFMLEDESGSGHANRSQLFIHD